MSTKRFVFLRGGPPDWHCEARAARFRQEQMDMPSADIRRGSPLRRGSHVLLFGAGLLTPPRARPQVSRAWWRPDGCWLQLSDARGDLRSAACGSVGRPATTAVGRQAATRLWDRQLRGWL